MVTLLNIAPHTLNNLRVGCCHILIVKLYILARGAHIKELHCAIALMNIHNQSLPLALTNSNHTARSRVLPIEIFVLLLSLRITRKDRNKRHTVILRCIHACKLADCRHHIGKVSEVVRYHTTLYLSWPRGDKRHTDTTLVQCALTPALTTTIRSCAIHPYGR